MAGLEEADLPAAQGFAEEAIDVAGTPSIDAGLGAVAGLEEADLPAAPAGLGRWLGFGRSFGEADPPAAQGFAEDMAGLGAVAESLPSGDSLGTLPSDDSVAEWGVNSILYPDLMAMDPPVSTLYS